MRFKNVVPYKLKRLIPMLGLAGATMLGGCSKDDDPMHDVEIVFYNDSDITFDILKKHAADPTVRNIYMIPPQNDRFMVFMPEHIHNSRHYFFGPRFEISPKIKARGDFRFEPGVPSQVPEDSLWYVQQGWTVNKYLQNQK